MSTTGFDLNDMEEIESEKLPDLLLKDPLPTVAEMIRDRIRLTGYDAQEHWTEEHTNMVESDYQPEQSNRALIAYLHPRAGLQIEFSYPTMRVPEVAYFIKNAKLLDEGPLTNENFEVMVQHGTVGGRGIESLLRLMVGVYAPTFFANTSWPDSIKNDFSLQLHRFMSSLTDTRWKMEGKTVLYVPTEGMDLEPDVASKDKDLVNRLEMIMIHWTRQIKEVLSSQNAFEDQESSGPLEEIDFWKNRCDDLSGISKQLDKRGVKHITCVLEAASSSYVPAFMKLATEIKANTTQALSNLKFLSSLKEQCHDLADARPKDIPPMLPRLINRIRMIWVNSEYYNTREAVTSMFRKLSNEIIRRCCREVSLDKIFDGFITTSVNSLNDCINCCESYKDVYNRVSLGKCLL